MRIELRRALVTVAALGSVFFALETMAACSGDDDAIVATADAATTKDATSTNVQMDAGDFVFDGALPTSTFDAASSADAGPSVLQAAVGSADAGITRFDAGPATSSDAERIQGTTVDGTQTLAITVNATAPGTYACGAAAFGVVNQITYTSGATTYSSSASADSGAVAPSDSGAAAEPGCTIVLTVAHRSILRRGNSTCR